MMQEQIPLKASIEIVHFDRDGNVITIETEEIPVSKKED